VAEQAYAYVTLIPVAKGFQGAIAKELGGVNNVGKTAGKKAGKGFGGGFGGALKGLGGIIAGGLAAAGIGSFVKDSISQASSLGESINALEVTFSDLSASSVDELKKISDGAAVNFGLSKTEFNGLAVQFSSFATKIAGPGGDVVDIMETLAGRGADFASVMDLDVADAMAMFQSGLAGEAEPLKKFGIDISQASIEAYALANGIGEAGRQLTESEKVQARYGAIMEQTAKTQGDFGNTSDSLANAQRILGAQFENMKAEVGGPLLNAFADLTAGLMPVVEMMGPILVGVMEELAPIIADLAGQIPGLLEGFLPLLPVLGDLVGIFLELAADLLPVFVDLVMALMPAITELLPLFAELIGDAFEVLIPILVQVIDALVPIVEALLPVFMEIFEALAPVMLTLIEAFLPLIDLLLPMFIEFIEFLTPILLFVAEVLGEVLVFGIDLFIGAVEGMTANLEVFGTFFGDLWEGLKDFFEDTINGMIGGFEAFVNFVIRGVNRIVGALNGLRFEVPDWVPEIGGSTLGFNIPTIPEITLGRVALAKGGLVTGPTNALVGEAGPEVVMPLDRFEKMMGIDGGGGQSVNYYAAPNKSFDAEQELRLAMQRVRAFA
jgi:phage-related protein